MPPLSRFLVLILAPALFCLNLLSRGDGPAKPPTKLDFNRDIRPLLAENCFACHGPDAKKRKGDLRLDVKDPTHQTGKILVPGKVGESELIHRLLTSDAGKLMPPAKSGKKLTPAQIALVKRWVEEGATYAEHWAFVAPKRPALPETKRPAWARNGIDRFILSRLEREGMAPSAEADRVTLIRRVTLDLTGLPPTTAEIDAFIADRAPDAYERVVDRLLRSPRYAEQMGRHWLDLARFGDTHGLHLDNYREMWPYRDWVLRAFAENKPFDAFLTEQLAGDLLPGGRLADLVATGFNRAHVTTSEGGSITEEVHVRNVIDRVETVGTVFLGLTVGCARCHDHKYDPITQKDFYSLSAYFNSVEGSPLDGNASRHPPVIRVPTPEQAVALDELNRKVRAVEVSMAEQSKGLRYDDTLDSAKAEQPKRADFVWIDDAAPPGVQTMTDAKNAAWTFVKEPVYSGAVSLKHTAKGMGQHFFTGAKPGLTVGADDKLFAHVYLDPKNPPKAVMLQWHTDGWKHRAYWGANVLPFGKDDSPERQRLGDLPAPGKWVRLEVPAEKVGLTPGIHVTGWAFTQHDGTVYWDKAGLVTQVPQAGAAHDTLGGWVQAQRALKGVGLPADIAAIVVIDRTKRTPQQQKTLTAYFVRHAWSKGQEALAPLHRRLALLATERTKLEQQMPMTLVFKELPTPTQAYILTRGEYDQRGKPVGRETPGFLPALPTKGPKDRLALARWMLAEQNPLTARVAVNRLWQQVFGAGLVRTSEDLGTQGEGASHPELLDWLAVDFRDNGWDVRRTMRLIVTSAAYRQSSKVMPDRLAKDPTNRLLSRGVRYRLDAEAIRDQALAVSGLLVERLGGPSVKPPQPDGLWKAVSYVGSDTSRFTADKGHEKVHRRSLYTFWKRTSPPPQMSTFDAPSRESCTPRRERTNTPMQALLLLNDPQYIECSRVLAQRALREGGSTDSQRIAWLFRQVTGRVADEKERAELLSALRDLRAEFVRDADAAKKLVAIGETKADAALSPSELAAWTMIASTLLNLDEVVNKG
jgi:mono/diheme cytochrome c family protein